MKSKLLHIIYVSLLATLSVACSNVEEELPQPKTEEKAQIVFTLALNDTPRSSRAGTWGDNYDPIYIGDTFDNRILPEQLHVALEVDGNYREIEDLRWQQGANINEYEFTGKIPEMAVAEGKLTGKVMVFANMGENFSASSSNQDGLTYGKDVEAIPMWGVKTLTNITIVPGVQKDLGTIYLLRSMAKVEVTLDGAVTNFTLADVSFNRYNQTGYCLPKGHDTATDTKVLDLEDCLRIPTQTPSSTLAFRPDESNNRRFYIYVPEFENVGVATTDAQSSLSVTLRPTEATEQAKAYTINFVNYGTDGKPTDTAMNIVRNHLYRFNIKSVTVDDSGKIKTDIYTSVNPWEVITLEPGYE